MSATKYADFLFLRYVSTVALDEIFGNRWVPEEGVLAQFQESMRSAFAEYGYHVDTAFDDLALETLQWLMNNKVFFKEGDDYTGVYLHLNPSKKKEIVDNYLANHEIAKRIKVLGEDALTKALAKIYLEEAWGSNKILEPVLVDDSTNLETAPASDRIVTFSDNQINDLESQTTRVIDAVASQNQIDGEPGLREILLGQLKAGRELIRAGSFRLYLIELTLIDALNRLVRRYEKETIGAIASALIAALAKHIGLDA